MAAIAGQCDQEVFLLMQPLGSDDKLLTLMLDADRYGRESWEMHCFTHGLPTRNTGAWLPDADVPTCGFDTVSFTGGTKIFVFHPQTRPWALGSGGFKLRR